MVDLLILDPNLLFLRKTTISATFCPHWSRRIWGYWSSWDGTRLKSLSDFCLMNGSCCLDVGFIQ